ncbi:MAG: POTRA domain-containing protein [Myxococcota bacterium]|nr:POTRA domain-containing protein [Myxococcota bacterium]
MGIGLIAGFLSAAMAAGVPWFVGEPVAQVSLEAATGTLPDDNLEPLLRTQPGEPLSVGTLRSDVALLVSAGGFLSVEAMVEPWITVDEFGRPDDAVKVVYRVISAPKVRSIQISGVRGAARKAVERGLDVDLGDAWFGASERAQVEASVQDALRESGWSAASVALESTADDGAIRLLVSVDRGPPQRVGEIRVGGELPVSERVIRAWLKDGGLQEGRRFDQAQAERARLRVLDRLRSQGWGRPRVSVFVQDGSDPAALKVSVLVAAGPQLVIEASGRRTPRDRILRDAMGLKAGDRISDNAIRDAADRLVEWYGDQGYRDATVTAEMREQSRMKTVVAVKTKPGRRHWLKRVRFAGDLPLTPRVARAVMDEAAGETLADQVVSDEGIRRARRGLLDRLRSDGFLDASVAIDEKLVRFGGLSVLGRWGVPVELMVRVEAGEPVRVETVQLRGDTGIAKPIIERWNDLHAGGPLLASATSQLEAEVVDAYEDRGFIDVDVSVSTVRNRVAGTATVDVRINPGEAIALRSVVIRGNRRTRRNVIEREVMVEPGAPISPDAIGVTRSNLYNLDLFRLVSPELVGDEPGLRDLVVSVTERPNVLLEAGGGISTDQGIRTTGRATHRNIAGRGHRLTALGSVGYGWDGEEWALDTATPVWRSAARYEIPYVPGRGGRLVGEALINETVQEPSWRLSKTGGSLGMNVRLSGRSEARVDYRVQVRRLLDVDPGVLVNGDPWVPYLGLDEDLSGAPILDSEARVISGGSLLVVHDQRDDRFNPTSGGVWSGQVEFGDGAFTGTVTMRAQGKVERLIPVGGFVLDLIGRGGLGFAQGRTVTLPLEERFFLGGGASMRGFATDSVGPANFGMRPEIEHPSQTEPVVDGLGLPGAPGHWVATGGDAMAAGTVELRMPLSRIGLSSETTSLVLFSDFGTVAFLDPTVVTTSIVQQRDPFMRMSFGGGLRFVTPVGPASFDVGFNPSPMEERNEAWVTPHLSLGVL